MNKMLLTSVLALVAGAAFAQPQRHAHSYEIEGDECGVQAGPTFAGCELQGEQITVQCENKKCPDVTCPACPVCPTFHVETKKICPPTVEYVCPVRGKSCGGCHACRHRRHRHGRGREEVIVREEVVDMDVTE